MKLIKPIVFTVISLFLSSCLFESKEDKVPGFNFSYEEIERFCRVKRSGKESIVAVCSEKRLKLITIACAGYVVGGLRDTQFNCGGDLWQLTERCKIRMTSVHGGEIDCSVGDDDEEDDENNGGFESGKRSFFQK